MIITKESLQNNIYQYQLDSITNNNDTIVEQGIAVAIEEMKSYMSARYNTSSIFDPSIQTNAFLTALGKDIAIWHIAKLAHVDMINIKDRYEYSIKWLKDLANGNVTMDLPLKTNAPQTQFIIDSHTKFNHDY